MALGMYIHNLWFMGRWILRIQWRNILLTSLVGRCILCGEYIPLLYEIYLILTPRSSIALEAGIFVSQAIWLYRIRHVRREAKKAGKSYDQFIAEHPGKNIAVSEAGSSTVDLEAGARDTGRETAVHSEESSKAPSIAPCMPEMCVVRGGKESVVGASESEKSRDVV
jgi:hypothetical protein